MHSARLICGLPIFVLALGCSKTTPDSQYPPPVGPLPYIPLPDNGDSLGATETPKPATPGSPAQPSGGAPSAIEADLPASPPASLARSHACKDKECRFADFLPDPKFAKSEPAGSDTPGTLWLEELAPDSAVVLPRDHQLELVALVISGDAVANGDEGGAFKLGVWSALRAQGCGVAIRAGKSGAKVVLGLAATAKGNLAELIAGAKAKPFAVRWAKRPTPLASLSLSNMKDLSWAGGAFHVRIAYGSEAPIPASLETLKTSANAAIKEHDHPAWEHIAILQGSGTMTVAGTDHAVSAGSVFDLAPGTKHAFTPSGKEPLLAVQMYTPSGPEQRFVKLASEASGGAKTTPATLPAPPAPPAKNPQKAPPAPPAPPAAPAPPAKK